MDDVRQQHGYAAVLHHPLTFGCPLGKVEWLSSYQVYVYAYQKIHWVHMAKDLFSHGTSLVEYVGPNAHTKSHVSVVHGLPFASCDV